MAKRYFIFGKGAREEAKRLRKLGYKTHLKFQKDKIINRYRLTFEKIKKIKKVK